jgi:DNA-binding response OmpR family regulator
LLVCFGGVSDSDDNSLSPGVRLSPRERAVYEVLANNAGRVVDRRQIVQHARLGELSERRCDSIISGLRHQIGPRSIVTVRQRGWMLVDD